MRLDATTQLRQTASVETGGDAVNKSITIARTYVGYAVYLDDVLMYQERQPAAWPSGMLKALGYTVESYGNGEHDFWGHQSYIPPDSLAMLKCDYAAWERRRKERQLAFSREEVRRLERELEIS